MRSDWQAATLIVPLTTCTSSYIYPANSNVMLARLPEPHRRQHPKYFVDETDIRAPPYLRNVRLLAALRRIVHLCANTD
jgi:hypothetical protein